MRALPDTPQAGLTILIAAFLIAPGMDVFAKLLTQTVSPGMVGLGRFAVQSVLLIPLVLMMGQWSRPRLGHWLAGAFLAAALLCFNTALQVMPIANAIAIFFVEPLVVTILSALFLNERIGWRRILAVLAGLCGAMIVIRPNFQAYGIAAVLPLGTALFFACYLLITKTMAAGPNKLALQLWTGVSAMLVFLAATLWGSAHDIAILTLTVPTAHELVFFAGMGGLAVVAHQMIVHGLARVDASVLAPLQYLEIVSAVLFGWWIFADFPDRLTWLGAAIIIGSGIYVFHRERQSSGEPS